MTIRFCLISSFILLASVSFGQKRHKVKSKPTPVDTSFVLVEGGSFKMGSDKPVEPHESPSHQVTVNSFYIKKTEVTFEEFDKYTKATGKDSALAGAWGRGLQPVFMVSWFDAVQYCNWLSEQQKLSKYYIINGREISVVDTANGYRLPTEAEWEYAARGGNKSRHTYFAGSDTINEVGWYIDNSEGRTHPVRQKRPNELGLYDMNGNVWEWVWDVYDWNYYKTSPAIDPRGPASGPYRVMRGGAWYNYGNYAQVTTRQNHDPGFRQNSVGFRIARSYR